MFIICLGIVITQIGCSNGSGSGQRAVQALPDSIVAPVEDNKSSYNIYIDNSASMDGFVTIGSDFKNAVLGMISDLRSKNLTDTISLYYINKQICPQKTKALSADIIYFINNLNPATFKNSGCGRETSYLPNILKSVIAQKKNDINILISDNIFSDSTGTSPSYLEEAENSTKLFFSDELHKNAFSSLVLKLSSQFNGTYYVESRRPMAVDVSEKKIRRPYYMMIFGKRENMHGFLSKLNFHDYAGFENSYYLLTPQKNVPPAKLIRNNKIGDFEIQQPAARLTIVNANAGGRNNSDSIFQFSMAVNLSSLNMDDSYLLDKSNYETAGNYEIVSILKNNDPTNQSLKEFTHVFTIRTKDLKQQQEVNLRLTSNVPAWVEKSSNIDDSDPLSASQQSQTFGLKYLIGGVAKAYANQYPGKGQFSLTINVYKTAGNADGSNSKALFFLIILLFVTVGVFIWIKNKK